MKNQTTNNYLIRGGSSIQGTIRVNGNKNAALPCLAACLLTEEPVILREIPFIEDVTVTLEIIESLGGEFRWLKPGVLEVSGRNLKSCAIPEEKASLIRSSILFAGPLLARCGKAVLPPPGGDVIGRRRLDTHFMAFAELGVKAEINAELRFSVNALRGADIFLDEASVTATENALMASVIAEGRTTIVNAASEPHVQDLCRLLNRMGGKISGIGSNILRIEGVDKLGGADFTISSDYMEAGSFIGLAAITPGEVIIENACPDHLRMIRLGFGRLGIKWETCGQTIRVPDQQSRTVVADLGGMIPKIDDAPWPGFPADLTSIMTVVATQVKGTILIHEKMFESRMFFVDKLIGMGARIILCDPHRVVVSGPACLRGSYLVSPDVRAGMAMVIAALCAQGESTIDNVYQIERGYQKLAERLQALGAVIRKRSGSDC